MRRHLSSFLLIISLNACAGTSVTRLKQAPPKSEGCQLEIYASEAEVPRKFDTLCIVEGHTSTRMFADRTMSGAIDIARPELCGCGADAAIIVDGASSSWGGLLPAPVSETRGNVKLKAIRFVE